MSRNPVEPFDPVPPALRDQPDAEDTVEKLLADGRTAGMAEYGRSKFSSPEVTITVSTKLVRKLLKSPELELTLLKILSNDRHPFFVPVLCEMIRVDEGTSSNTAKHLATLAGRAKGVTHRTETEFIFPEPGAFALQEVQEVIPQESATNGEHQ